MILRVSRKKTFGETALYPHLYIRLVTEQGLLYAMFLRAKHLRSEPVECLAAEEESADELAEKGENGVQISFD